MARRRFQEGEHPRHPAGSGQGGEFREKWASQLSDRIGLPNAKDLLRNTPPNTEIEGLGEQLNGPYGIGGMHVQNAIVSRFGGGDDSSTFMPLGHLNISGEIVDDAGDEGAGYFRVTAYQDRETEGDPLYWRASIDRMHVRGEARGGGGGRELTERLIEWFRQSGFDDITVGPSEIGSYAWGSIGFDFADHESRRIAWESAMAMSVQQVRDHFRFTSYDYGATGEELSDAQIKKMIAQYRRATTIAVAGGMSYQKLSQYGRKPGQGKDDWWAGKLGLIVGGVGTGRIKL